MKEPISEKIPSMYNVLRKVSSKLTNDIRVAMPAIVQSFDPVSQTITAKIAIRERYINEELVVSNVEIPVLPDVPIVIPRAGNYALTLPVQPGDECLIIFADMCIDAWFSNSGVQNQIESRRHDLSDAFAILGTWSQPRKIQNYSTDSIELRNLNGTAKIKLKDNTIDLIGTVKVNGVII